MSTSIALYRPEDHVPNDLLRSMAQTVAEAPQPGNHLNISTPGHAREVLNNWCLEARDGLPELFEQAEHQLRREDTAACRSMADAFDHRARRSLASACNALRMVQRELGRKTPSGQMIRQALSYAHGEMEEVHARIRERLKEACSMLGGDEKSALPSFMRVDDAPVRAVDELQELKIMVKEGERVIPAFLKQQQQVSP